MALIRSLPRAIDDLPIWAHLNITWKCNLDCAYCTEYDNTKDHVPTDELKRRIDHCAELGVLHTDLIGGEPMLHPDLVPLMRHVRRAGMTTGMTTNGFRLTEEKLVELIDAGMGRVQISIDALKPKPGIPKSLKTLAPKIAMVARHPVWFSVNTVLCDETLDEVQEVAEMCFSLGVGINFSLVHDRGRLSRPKNVDRYLEKIEWLRQKKKEGAQIFTAYFLMEYFERALQGNPMDWTCQAGSKAFYVSPEGNFHFCFHVPSSRPFSSITKEDLSRNRGKKGCETNCGVDCMIHTSMGYSNKLDLVAVEARDRIDAVKQRVVRRVLNVLP